VSQATRLSRLAAVWRRTGDPPRPWSSSSSFVAVDVASCAASSEMTDDVICGHVNGERDNAEDAEDDARRRTTTGCEAGKNKPTTRATRRTTRRATTRTAAEGNKDHEDEEEEEDEDVDDDDCDSSCRTAGPASDRTRKTRAAVIDATSGRGGRARIGS